MLHLYIMHKWQEYTHSTFALSDAFRRAVGDFGLEARYLYVLATASAGQGRNMEGVAKNFCPALSLVQIKKSELPYSSSQQYWVEIQLQSWGRNGTEFDLFPHGMLQAEVSGILHGALFEAVY